MQTNCTQLNEHHVATNTSEESSLQNNETTFTDYSLHSNVVHSTPHSVDQKTQPICVDHSNAALNTNEGNNSNIQKTEPSDKFLTKSFEYLTLSVDEYEENDQKTVSYIEVEYLLEEFQEF